MKRLSSIFVSVLFACSAPVSSRAASLDPVVSAWLTAQSNVQSWSADFVQTRSFKSLTVPLTEKGHVWFSAPNRFRWELGTPPKTIAVRATNEMLVIYPRLKRAERFALDANAAGPWKDALALLEAGFPRNADQLESQYDVENQVIQDAVVKLVLRPKSSAARRMMPQIQIEFNRTTQMLQSTELHFADGSLMRNDFSNSVLNAPVDPAQFSPQLPPDYMVVEPLKK